MRWLRVPQSWLPSVRGVFVDRAIDLAVHRPGRHVAELSVVTSWVANARAAGSGVTSVSLVNASSPSRNKAALNARWFAKLDA